MMKRNFLSFVFAFILIWNSPQKGYSETWSAPVNLSLAGANATNPKVVMNNSGQTIAVWERNNVIQASTLLFDGVWSAVQDLSSLLDTCSSPQISTNSSGQTVAIWVRQNGADFNIQTATLLFGEIWSAASSISSTGVNASSPKVQINASGQTVALWHRNNGTDDLIESATLTFGGAWSAVTQLSASGQNATQPSLAMNDSSQVVAVWRRNDVIQGRTLTYGENWSSVANISLLESVSNPIVYIDSSGSISLTWRRTVASNEIFERSSASFGDAWDLPIILCAHPAGMACPTVKMNALNHTAVIWAHVVDGISVIQFTSCFERGWSPVTTLSDSAQSAIAPNLAFNDSEETVAIWTRSNGTHTIIQASTARLNLL